MPRDLVGGAGARLKSSLIPMNRPFRGTIPPKRTGARPLTPTTSYREVIPPISLNWPDHPRLNLISPLHFCPRIRRSCTFALPLSQAHVPTCQRALAPSIRVPSSGGLRRPYTTYSKLYTLVALTARHSRGRALSRACRARGRRTPGAPAHGDTASPALPSRRRSA